MAVSRNADANPRSADQDKAFPLIHSSRGPVREIRVIHRSETIRRAKVHRFVPLRKCPRLQAFLEVITCMIASKANFHVVSPIKKGN